LVKVLSFFLHLSLLETADCSLDEIDFGELSEMWTKEFEFSFETLCRPRHGLAI
jgi:hypothetical protein